MLQPEASGKFPLAELAGDCDDPIEMERVTSGEWERSIARHTSYLCAMSSIATHTILMHYGKD